MRSVEDTATDSGLLPGPVGNTVRRVLAEVLNGAGIDPDRSLRDHGVDSMGAARLWLAVSSEHGAEVPIEWFGDNRSVRELVAALDEVCTDDAGARGGTTGCPRPGADAAAPGERHGPFSPTPLQQAHLFASCAEVGADAVGCHIYRELTVDGLDVDRLVAAWERLVAHHDALRMVLGLDGHAIIEKTAPRWSCAVHRPESAAASAGCRAAVRHRLVHRRVEPGEWPPFAVEVTLAPDGAPAVVHFGLSALVTDGFGMALLLDQWAACYADPGHVLPEPRVSLRQCLDLLRSGRDEAPHAAALARSVARLRDLPDGPALVGNVSVGPAELPGLRRRVWNDVIDAPAWSALRALAARWEVSATALVLTVFAETLARYGADEPFTLTLTTNDRVRLPAAARDLVGPFTATSLFVAERTLDDPLPDAVRRTHRQLWQGLADGAACGVSVLRELRSRGVVRREVALPVVFTSLLGALPPGADGFAAAVTHACGQTADVALDHQMWERDGALHLQWDVTEARFTGVGPSTLFPALVSALYALAASADGQDEPHELTELARAFVVARGADPTGIPVGCQLHVCHHLDRLDPARLEKALCRLAERHPALRDTIGHDGRLRRAVSAPRAWRVPVVEVTAPADGAATVLAAHDAADARVRQSMTAVAFPLGRRPHLEIRVTTSTTRTSVHLAGDLAVLDARSIRSLATELMWELCDAPAPVAARPAVAPIPSARERGQAAAHWRARLAEIPPGPPLPTSGPRRRIGRVLRGAATRLAEAAAEVDLSPDAMLLAALAGALAEPGAAAAEVGVTVVRLPASGGELGERTALSWVATGQPDPPLAERARGYQRVLDLDAGAAAVHGLREMRRRALRAAAGTGHPVVYTSLFDLADEPLPPGVRRGEWMTSTPGVAVDAITTRDGDDLTVYLDVAEDAFDGAAAERLLDRYAGAVEAIQAAGPADRPLHALLAEQAAARPRATAVVTRHESVTFGELDAWANRVAQLLRERGVGRGTMVGVRTRRGAAMVAAVIGVLKAGGTYLPLEPSLPADRVAGMLADAAGRVVVTTGDTPPWPAPEGIDVVELDSTAVGEPVPAPPCDTDVDDTAYVIFTSGSTGRPKGVAVPHRAVLNLLNWCDRTFTIGPVDRGLGVTSLGFDLSVFDLFGILGRGASLYVADEEEQRDPAALLEILLNRGITVWNSAPTTLAQIGPLMAAQRGHPGAESLRLVLLSGDYIPLSLPDTVRAVFTRADLISLGGATEATVWSNWFRIGAVDPQWRSVPYGYPIDNARYHVLDDQMRPCPAGVEGDLYIGGVCLSKGYVGRPDLTAERFVRDPFHDDPAERLYRTGDRARYRPDGCLVFLGRADNQVKIRGHRVELGEIEHVVREHPDVADVVVLARPDESGDTKVVAYVRPEPGAAPTVRAIRSRAARLLPTYMVPNVVAFVDGFPATANGKLDRKALPWPVASAAAPALAPAAPAAARAELVSEVAELFGQLLGVEQIGPDEDLWDLGATSFTMVQVSGMLQSRRGTRIPVAALLTDPTVANVARHLAAAAGSTGAGPVEAAPQVEEVDFFDRAARARFKAAGPGRRPAREGEPVVPLPPPRDLEALHGWRASRRDFGPEPVPWTSLGRLLGLLGPVPGPDGGTRRLYPSAGDTYAVQVYLQLGAGSGPDLAEGIYHLDPVEHALRRIGDRALLDGSCHVGYNRPVAHRARFTILLVGQRRGIEPLYGEQSLRYLTLEAGGIAQLLMSGQAAAGLGLCPVGAMSTERVVEALGLDEGHVFLLALLGGVVDHQPGTAGVPAPYSDPAAPALPAAPKPEPEPAADTAVVGMALRLPGAADPDAFWQGLLAGRSAVGPVPESRRDDVGDAPPGAYFTEIGQFDNLLFHIAHDDAAELDPQARLLLETVWQAIDDSGRTPQSLRDLGRIGVFIGAMWHDHQHRGADLWRDGGPARVAATASEMANRVSHCFDFRGPSLAVDTSCSSSLTALDLAVRSLRRGECDVAVVGAVNLLTHPYHASLLSGLELVSPRFRDAYDGVGSGWSPGEGCGVVILRPADVAGDVVHGVIEATWTGHAGRSGRFGAPSVDALVESLHAVLGEAGRNAADVDYAECAAAGAGLADAAELEALGRVWEPTGSVLPVGTVKPNTGHLEAASGMTQLVKALLQLRHRRIAPTLLASTPSPLVEWDRLPLSIVDRPCALTNRSADGRATVLVTALGAGGGIGHALVRAPERTRVADPPAAGPGRPGRHLVPLSATDRAALALAAGRLHDHLVEADALQPVSVADVAGTLQHGRIHQGARLMIRCADLGGLLAGLRAAAAGRPAPGVRLSSPDPALADVSCPATSVEEVAAAWSDGYTVDFSALTTAPWRRIALPGTRFGGDRHRLPRSASGAGTAHPDSAAHHPASPDGTAADASTPETDPRVERIERYLIEQYAAASGIPADRLHPTVDLEYYGLSSRIVARLDEVLSRDVGDVSRTLFFAHPNLSSIARELSPRSGPWDAGPGAADLSRPADAVGAGVTGDAVAVIGIAGRYPQAPDLPTFWANLLAGRDAITPLPVRRARPGWPTDLMWGGYIDDVDCFDSQLFGITPRDAARMDPQERLFLEVVWETLDDAGYPRTRLAARHRHQVGVFAGVMYNEYPFFAVERSLTGPPTDAGSAVAGIANRVSYVLDLHGPSMAVDTMCSSSLTCVHLAVQSLLRGECAAALAGGVNLSLHPHKFVQQQRLGMSATGHRCRSFGDGGDGFVPAEGVGAVLLKPLAAALADGDRVHAVIRGTAVNHGGRTNGFMVPSPVAQADLVATTIHRAGIDPATLSYVEAHGTGTELGDPIEIDGLERAFAGALGPRSCAIGSVKSGIGHAEAAAGIAGLTKVVLQMRHRMLVPTLHTDRLSTGVNWERSPLRVVRDAEPWPRTGGPRRAGVSSFGAGGANAHVILEESPPEPEPIPEPGHPQLVVLSARDPEHLVLVAQRLVAALGDPLPTLAALDNVAWTLQVGREALRERLAVVVDDLPGLCEVLTRFLRGADGCVLRGRAPSAAEPRKDLAHPSGVERDELARLARHWVEGGRVAWEELHPQRRRVVSLPSYPFARVRHWVDDGRASAPVAAGLWERTWAEDASPATAPPPPGPVLCVVDERTGVIANALESLLDGPLVRLEVSAGSPDDARDDVAAFLGRHPSPAGWIDLTDLGTGHDEPGRAAVRRAALQALVAARHGSGLRVLHAVHGLLELPGPVPSLAGARLASVVRMLTAEHPRVVASVVDVEDAAPAAAARAVAAEWARTDAPGEVALRGGRRLRPRLVPLVEPAPAPVLRADPDRCYLVTGATGGLGSLVAQRLVERGARQLLLLGRGAPGAGAQQLAQRLTAAGARVLLRGGCLTSRAWLESVLSEARRLGPIGGVVHCAGTAPAGRSPFVHTADAVLDAVAEAKVDGLDLLASLCEGDAPEFFVLFSSLSAVAPRLAVGVLGYSAANAYLGYFAAHQTATGRPQFRAVAWPTWKDSGMGAADPEASAACGVAALTDEQGLDVLERVIALPGRYPYVIPCSPVEGPDGAAPAAVLDFPRPGGAPRRAAPPRPVAAPERPGWVSEVVAGTLGIPAGQLDPAATFQELGAESVVLTELLSRLESRLGHSVDPTILFEHPTTAALSEYLLAYPPESAAGQPGTGPAGPVAAVWSGTAPGAGGPLRIAVVGMACRFPGAPDPDEFWELLRKGRCAVGEVPPSRWDTAALYRPSPELGFSTSRWGGFVDGLEDFDAARFGMRPEEAAALDPGIRMILETSLSALADAGHAETDVAGRDVGVFVGTRLSTYRQRAARSSGAAATVGSDQNFAAARIGHQFDLHGPNLVVDTACSSSLVAIQLACRSLLAGESELALAGGADVLLDEEPYLDFSAAGALSASGRCRTFDQAADGFVPGEGAGMLLLKPLARALADGDPIRAVIEAVAVNNDGRTMGLTTPNPLAQARVVRRALAEAGVAPDQVGMVEAHGTATRLGDPIELRALTEVFREGTDRAGFCAVGSVKSNIGHLLSAAGIAGVVKAVLSLQHGTIPPTLFCDQPNPRFDFAASPFVPAREPMAWPAGRRVAGVSAFGLGGTNAHLVLTDADLPRPDGVPVRAPAPAPVFRRERSWLDRPAPPKGARAAPAAGSGTASLLDLSLLDLQLTDASAHHEASPREVQPW